MRRASATGRRARAVHVLRFRASPSPVAFATASLRHHSRPASDARSPGSAASTWARSSCDSARRAMARQSTARSSGSASTPTSASRATATRAKGPARVRLKLQPAGVLQPRLAVLGVPAPRAGGRRTAATPAVCPGRTARIARSAACAATNSSRLAGRRISAARRALVGRQRLAMGRRRPAIKRHRPDDDFAGAEHRLLKWHPDTIWPAARPSQAGGSDHAMICAGGAMSAWGRPTEVDVRDGGCGAAGYRRMRRRGQGRHR